MDKNTFYCHIYLKKFKKRMKGNFVTQTKRYYPQMAFLSVSSADT